MQQADQPVFDRAEQYEAVASGLLPGERIFAVYECVGQHGGFAAITSLRFIIQDHSIGGHHNAITSVPYTRITSVSAVANKARIGRAVPSSSIAVSTGHHTFLAELGGDEKAAHVHNVVLHYIASPA